MKDRCVSIRGCRPGVHEETRLQAFKISMKPFHADELDANRGTTGQGRVKMNIRRETECPK